MTPLPCHGDVLAEMANQVEAGGRGGAAKRGGVIMTETANLQKLTVRQAARAMYVSERMVHLAAKLLRSGRQDLIAKVDAGEMSLQQHKKNWMATPNQTASRPCAGPGTRHQTKKNVVFGIYRGWRVGEGRDELTG